MKIILNKMSKKAKYTILGIVFIVLAIADVKCSQAVKEKSPKRNNIKVEVIKSESPKDIDTEEKNPTPSLETFEKVQEDYDKDSNASGKMIEEIDDTLDDSTYKDKKENKDAELDSRKDRQNLSSSEKATNEKKIIIDESEETIKDETEGKDEKEYDVNQEPQGKINWNVQSKKAGREVNGDVPAGGKQGVGVWS